MLLVGLFCVYAIVFLLVYTIGSNTVQDILSKMMGNIPRRTIEKLHRVSKNRFRFLDNT